MFRVFRPRVIVLTALLATLAVAALAPGPRPGIVERIPQAIAATPVSHAGEIAGGTVASALTVTAQRGEGVIAITTRACGNAYNWQTVAAANRIVPPSYIVQLGQTLTVSCVMTLPNAPPAAAPAPANFAAWVHPLPGAALGCYGWRQNPTGPGTQLHQGLDMSAAWGTTVRAASGGQVERAGWIIGGYGISMIIRHYDGTRTHYAHLSSTWLRPGQWVLPGTGIAAVGSTGDSTGPHLHFEIWSAAWFGSQVNPAPALRARGVAIGC